MRQWVTSGVKIHSTAVDTMREEKYAAKGITNMLGMRVSQTN